MRTRARRTRVRLLAAATVLVAAAGCVSGVFTSRESRPPVPLGLDRVVPTPVDNAPTASKLALGRRLFFDPILSLDGTRTCSSCHQPEHAFSDVTAKSLGIGGHPTRRNAPALINRAWGESLFRDGRARSLEEAVLQPVFNPTELGMTTALLEDRLRAAPEYRRLFRVAFEEAPPPFELADDPTSPTSAQVAAALSTFIRSLRSGDAPIDRYRAGDNSALTPLQKEGRALFMGRARCSGCHLGTNFTDERFHNTGVAVRSGDPGRYAITGNRNHEGAFRTPTLRDVSLTAPYMHDGSLATLEDVIDFYDKGGVENANLNSQIRRIGLDPSEKAALVAFLGALTGAGR